MLENSEMTEENNEYWDLVISPTSSIFSLNLKELWGYRDLIYLFVKRDITAQYKQTILGPLWHVIQPLFTTLVFLLIFKSIANISTDDIEPAFLFYMSGITIWNYFSACLTSTSGTFVSNAGIFGKVYFPRLVIPISVVLSNVVKFCIQFFLLLAVMIYCGINSHHFYFGFSWLLIPVLVLMMAALGFGLGVIISSLTTKYRDFTVLISFAVQLLMYATPIAYPLSYLKQKKYFHLIEYNPLSPIVEAFRYALFGKGSFDTTLLALSAVEIVVILMVGIIMFNKVERSFMDTV